MKETIFLTWEDCVGQSSVALGLAQKVLRGGVEGCGREEEMV